MTAEIAPSGLEITVHCCLCPATALAWGPSSFPTGATGWWLDHRNFYSANADHLCPIHARGRRRY